MVRTLTCDSRSQVRIPAMTLPSYFWDRWRYFAGKLSWDITATQVNSALHPSGVAKSSTSFGCGKGGKVTSAGRQVTLCDLLWHVISRSGVVISITNCYIRFTLLYFTQKALLSRVGFNTKAYLGDQGHTPNGGMTTHFYPIFIMLKW